MLEDALARFEGEVEAGKLGIAFLEFVNDAKRLQVVFESTVGRHRAIQGVLSGMAEWCMAQIVGKADRLDELLVQAEAITIRCRGPLGCLQPLGCPWSPGSLRL